MNAQRMHLTRALRPASSNNEGMLFDHGRSAQTRARVCSARLTIACSALALLSAACDLEVVIHQDATAPANVGDAAGPQEDPGDAGHADAAQSDAGSAADASSVDASAPGRDAETMPTLDAADSALGNDAALTDALTSAPPADATGDSMAADADTTGDAEAAVDAGPAAPAAPSNKQLAAGRAHACSLDPAISGLLCWGDNLYGQTGVPTLTNPSFVAAGGDVTCAIHKSGDVTCWGDNARHQLDVPVLLPRSTQVAVGDGHVCALAASGKVRCWGDDSAGQLQVPALEGVRSIGAGAQHSCALTAEGVQCWGDNAQGQRNAPALSGVTQLTVGGFHNCAIASGAVQCWGGSVPALLKEIPQVTAPTFIAAGRTHSCVIDRAGARCWGDPGARSLTPRELTWPRQIAIGGAGERAFACARHLQGVTCWGDDTQHQTEYNGYPSHVLYRSEAEIQAPAAVVWGVLMDLDNYGLWNPYTIAMKSTLKIGDPMIMTVVMNPLLTLEQTENIRVLEPGHKACWGIDTDTPELNSGERCQWLEPLAGGGTRYVTEDLIEGSLNLVVLGLFDNDLKAGFDGVARGLKSRAEALAKP
jgi:hypothetical protein